MGLIKLLIWTILVTNFSTVKISLHLTNSKDEMIYLKTELGIDSCMLKNGIANFSVNKRSSLPQQVGLYNKSYSFKTSIFIESNPVTVTGSMLDNKNLRFEGSQTQHDFLQYMAIIEPIKNKLNELKFKNVKQSAIDSIKKEILQKEIEFMNSNPESFISLYLPFFAFQNKNINAFDAIAMIESLPNSNSYQDEKKRLIEVLKQTHQLKNGEISPNFEMTDFLSKKTFSLRDYKGKVVLLNFWASWCGPCLTEMPMFKEFISDKKNKDIVFLSVSLDKSEMDLSKCIEKKQISWPVLTDLKGSDSQIVLDFGVSSLPATFVISKKGDIEIFRGSFLEDLQKIVDGKR